MKQKKSKQISDRRKNAIKLEVDPNIFSVLGFVGSCCLLVTTKLIKEQWLLSVVAFLLLLMMMFFADIFTRKVRTKLHNNDRAMELRERFNKWARLAGYWSYPLFALSVLDVMSK